MFTKTNSLAILFILFLAPVAYGWGVWGQPVRPQKTKGSATLVVAASDAPDDIRAIADYRCDGTADDVQIQAAIDAVVAGVAGKVSLSAGTFSADADINYASYVDIEGQGKYATIVKQEDSTLSANRHIFNFTNADYARLAHVQIHGNSANPDGNEHYGVYVSGTALGSSVEDCLILEFDRAAVYEDQDGIHFDDGSTPEGFTISRCSFLNIGDDGVDSNAAIAMRLEFCRFDNIEDCGIDSDGMVRSFIIGNYFSDCDLLGGAGGADSGAIELENGSNNNTVALNTIYQTGDAGDDDEYAIYIEASNNNTVIGNRIIVVTDGHGIYIEGDSDDNIVSNNNISGCSVAGITNGAGAQRNKFSNNLFTNCTANYATSVITSTPTGPRATFIWCDTTGLSADGYPNANGGAASVFAADKGFVAPRDGCITASTVTAVFSTETDTRTATFKVYEDGVDMSADLVITGDGAASREKATQLFVYGTYEFDAGDVLSVYYDEDAAGGMDWDDGFGMIEVQYYD